MADAVELIISAVDAASEVFQSIISSAQGMADGIGGAVDEASATFDMIADNVAGFNDAVSSIDGSALEELGNELGMSADEVQRLLEIGADMGTLSAGFNEASAAADELEKEIQEDIDAMDGLGSAGDVMAAESLMNMATGLSESMYNMADSAGTFGDSLMRAGLEAEGAGIPVEEMTAAVSELSETTGRAGGQIRETFIKATARGVTDVNSFKTMMEGAGAQATLFGTDIQTMGDKFSSLAMKSTLMERALSETGITMNELADAMGMSGATADEVKDKWKELDTNQRAAILGQAASMNEGKNANEEYKSSWKGLQEQMDMAKGRIERLIGSVILPTLIPAMKLAGDVLGVVGDAISAIMNGPLGGFVSILGTLGGVFIGAVAGALALKNMMGFLKLQTEFATIAQSAETFATIAQSEAGYAGAIANAVQTSSFGTLAASAWAAATAIWAALAPLLPYIAAAAAVVVVIYEVGKAFGWWTDVSSMIDAISAGLQRLWSAFVNHPDVQAVIQALSEAWASLTHAVGEAWNGVLEFFGIADSGEFDIVRALIDGIGAAWNAVKEPVLALINIYRTILTVLWDLVNGNTDVITAITAIWNSLVANIPVILMALFNVYKTIWTMIFNAVINIVKNIVNGVVSYFKGLVGKSYSALMGVVASIRSAIQAWINTAVEKVNDLINKIVSPLKELAGKIASAVSGVADAFAKPFKDAWALVEPVYNQLKGAWDFVSGTGWGGDIVDTSNAQLSAEGGDSAWGGDIGLMVSDSGSISERNRIVEDINLTLDFKNVPTHLDTNTLIEALTDRSVLRALTGNRDFQSLDVKYKGRLSNRNKRYNGV